MPNWCENKLILTAPDQAAAERFVVAYNRGEVCNEFVPVSPGDEDAELQAELWGTKWDFGADEYTRVIAYDPSTSSPGSQGPWSVEAIFSTAWCPPIGLYEALVCLGYVVDAMFFEPGVGFCGYYRDGEVVNITLNDFDSIPDDIVEAFGVEP